MLAKRINEVFVLGRNHEILVALSGTHRARNANQIESKNRTLERPREADRMRGSRFLLPFDRNRCASQGCLKAIAPDELLTGWLLVWEVFAN